MRRGGKPARQSAVEQPSLLCLSMGHRQVSCAFQHHSLQTKFTGLPYYRRSSSFEAIVWEEKRGGDAGLSKYVEQISLLDRLTERKDCGFSQPTIGGGAKESVSSHNRPRETESTK